MQTKRVTLTLDSNVVEATRPASGNFSRLVNRLLSEHAEALRRQELREELRQGYLAEAEADLEIVHEYRYVDRETAVREDS